MNLHTGHVQTCSHGFVQEPASVPAPGPQQPKGPQKCDPGHTCPFLRAWGCQAWDKPESLGLQAHPWLQRTPLPPSPLPGMCLRAFALLASLPSLPLLV